MKIGGRSIARIGAELREIALFPLTPEKGDRLLLLADQLVEIGALQRRLAELVDGSESLTPWRLRETLDVLGLVSARILCLLVKRPGMFLRRDMLVYHADTTITAIAGHLTLVRKALSSLGLAGELTTRDGCYSLSVKAAETLRRHCRATISEMRYIDYPKHVLQLLDEGQQMRGEAGAQRVKSAMRRPVPLSDLDLKFMMSLSSFIPLGSLSFRILQSLLETRETFTSGPELAARTFCSVSTLKVTIFRLRRCFAEQGLPDPVETSRLFGYRLSRQAATMWPQQAGAQ